MGTLSRTRVVVAGAGLAGLTAAYELGRRGAMVQVFEARDRLGGRVWTTRDDRGSVHVEAGGEFIDAEQSEIRALAKTLRVELVRILRGGFGLALEIDGTVRVHATQQAAWNALSRRLRPMIAAFEATDFEWSSATAVTIARRSLAETLGRTHANARLRALSKALRGFYLADPEALSALVVVEQAASAEAPGRSTMYRARDGNDALISALAKRLRGDIATQRIVRAMTTDEREVRVTVDDWNGRHEQTTADYVVMALPSPLVLNCLFDPPLPVYQQTALRSLTCGAATKVSLRFARNWWRKKSWPSAYGTNLPIGAVWEGAADQPGAHVLTFLAGGSGSAELQSLLASGPHAIVSHLSWMGSPAVAELVAPPVSWEDERWSLGGYAVFTTAFDPRLRSALAASHGRIVFAGEHTSEHWQGFMNGAVESGQRAAREIETIEHLRARLG